MMHSTLKRIGFSGLGAALALSALSLTTPAVAESKEAQLDCKLNYSLTTWSAIYKRAEGTGTVTCENGQRINVAIEAKGAGLTVGKSHIENGHGEFTDVRQVDDVLGNYAQAEAHAGVVKSGSVQVLTKGTVSLALAGGGEGVDLGVDIGRLTLKRR